MKTYTEASPCLACPRGMDPAGCEDKRCPFWRKWFLARWDHIHRYPRLVMEYSVPIPVGVALGGKYYAAPHQVRSYLKKDPCKGCGCTSDLCATPCRVRRAWDRANGEVRQ